MGNEINWRFVMIRSPCSKWATERGYMNGFFIDVWRCLINKSKQIPIENLSGANAVYNFSSLFGAR